MTSRKRTVVLLQIGYFPWIGFFEQLHRADIFVVFDDAQYTKLDWRNRNRVKSSSGKATYLTVPIQKCPTQTLINEVKISYQQNWVAKHLNQLKSFYGKSPFFNEYFHFFEELLSKKHELLADLLLEQLFTLKNLMGIETKIAISSELSTPEKGGKRLLAVCRDLGATHCYNGNAGKALYNPEEFSQEGIVLNFQDFKCPEYPQLWGDPFIPNLSIIDVLFNCGPETLSFITKGTND